MEHQRIPESPAVLPLFPRRVRPWWKRPVVALTVVLSAASFGIGAALATSGNSSDVPAQAPDQRAHDDRPAIQPQNVRPTGVSAAQKSQLLSKFCNQQAGGPTNVSEVALLECLANFYVTDWGQVLPR